MNAHRSGTCQRATCRPRKAAESSIGQRRRPLDHDAGERALVPPRVGDADDRRLDDLRVRHEVALELDRRDPLAARLDDVLGPVGDLDVAPLVEGADVAGAQPAVVELLGRRVAVVRAGDPRARGPRSRRPLRRRSAAACRRRRRCAARRPGMTRPVRARQSSSSVDPSSTSFGGWRDRGERARLGHAPGLDHPDAVLGLERLHQRPRHRRTAADDRLRAT